jgi:hypothetical protein
MVLRTAVNGIKAQYESEGHQLEEAITGILEKKPRLRKKYKRPDPSRWLHVPHTLLLDLLLLSSLLLPLSR